jgi:hypothetical protein
MAGRQQTAPPQQHRSKDDTAHPHQPGAHPDPPHPDRAHSSRHHPAKAKVKFPLRNRIRGHPLPQGAPIVVGGGYAWLEPVIQRT